MYLNFFYKYIDLFYWKTQALANFFPHFENKKKIFFAIFIHQSGEPAIQLLACF